MSTIRKLFVAALVALPIAGVSVANAEAGSRNHGGYSNYSNHGGYNKHNRGYGRRDHVQGRKSWFGRMHTSRRHSGGRSRGH